MHCIFFCVYPENYPLVILHVEQRHFSLVLFACSYNPTPCQFNKTLPHLSKCNSKIPLHLQEPCLGFSPNLFQSWGVVRTFI